MNPLKERIVELAHDLGRSHIGSALNAVDIIDRIYTEMKPEDRFVLSNGHAFMAQAVVLEKHIGRDAKELAVKHGTHPHRDGSDGVWVSTGSLGHGLGIALGMALANKERDVHCLVSDGECAEGSIWESLRIKTDLGVDNLKVHVAANGLGAYQSIDREKLEKRLKAFDSTLNFHYTSNAPLPETLDAHYQTI